MIRYWKEDTETGIGRPFDLERHDKEIANKWLEKAKEEVKEYKKRQLTLAIGVEDLEEGKQVALDYVIAVLDNLIAGSDEKHEILG